MSTPKKLTSASIDTGSVFNRDDAAVAHDFAAALSGSSETVQKYGINIKDAMVQLRLAEQGMDGLTGAALDQAKVMVKSEMILEGLTAQGVMGDAIRTAESYANQKKKLAAAFMEAKVAVGNALLPAVESLVPKLVFAAEAAAKWIAENEETVVLAGKVAVGLAAVGAALIGVSAAVSALSVAMGALPAILTAVAAGFAWAKGPGWVRNGIESIVNSVKDLVSGLWEIVTATERAKQLSRDITASGKKRDQELISKAKQAETEEADSGVKMIEKRIALLGKEEARIKKLIADLEKGRAAAEEKASGWFGDDTEISQLNLEVGALQERLKGNKERADDLKDSLNDVMDIRERAAEQAKAEAAFEEKIKGLQAQSQANKDTQKDEKSEAELEREKELRDQAAANKAFLKTLNGGLDSGFIRDPAKWLEGSAEVHGQARGHPGHCLR